MNLETKTDEEVIETIFKMTNKMKVMMPSVDREEKKWISKASLILWAKNTLKDDCNAPSGTHVSFVSIENLLDNLEPKDVNPVIKDSKE